MVAVHTLTRLRPIHAAVLLAGAAALLLTACSSDGGKSGGGTVTVTKPNGQVSTQTGESSASSAPSSPTGPPPKRVHIRTLNTDGATYGVGMPVIAYFSKKVKDGAPLQQATTVSVNGKKMDGAWFFETSAAQKGFPYEAHLRLKNYWPAHSRVHIGIAAKGVSAGKGLAYDDSLTLDFQIGPRNVSTVDTASHTMTVTSDHKKYGTFPVSLGANKTPTRRGTKVIMEQRPTVCMHDVNHTYYECGIKYDQRLTYDGEYLHSAPWNLGNIGHTDTSNGCTNLRPSDAIKLYHFLHVGDVVIYPNANGDAMQLGSGYGDWNVDWNVWQGGGLVPTR